MNSGGTGNTDSAPCEGFWSCLPKRGLPPIEFFKISGEFEGNTEERTFVAFGWTFFYWEFHVAKRRYEKRRHCRAKVKWPVVIRTPKGLVDGKTENLSLGGAQIRLSEELHFGNNLLMVVTAEDRFIALSAQIVWSTESDSGSNRGKPGGIGVRFTRMNLNDRQFLHSQIAKSL
jgi:Tfp pilus assembly protein PilZ